MWYKIENKTSDILSIDINQEIGAGGITSKDFISYVRDSGKKKIKLTIDSPGGSVFDAFAIYDYLRANKKLKVSVEIRGIAASAASIIALSGDTAPKISENSFLMIHNPFLVKMDLDYFEASDLRESAEQALNQAELLDTIKDKLINIYHGSTGLDKEVLSEMMDKETWLSADEALSMGFASDVIESVAVAAKVDPEKLGELGIKKAPKQIVNNQNQIKMDELNQKIADFKDYISNLIKPATDEKEVKEIKILENAEVQNKIASLETSIEEKASEITAKDEEIEALNVANATLTDEIAKLKGDKIEPEAKADEAPEAEGKTESQEKEEFGKAVLANLIENRYKS